MGTVAILDRPPRSFFPSAKTAKFFQKVLDLLNTMNIISTGWAELVRHSSEDVYRNDGGLHGPQNRSAENSKTLKIRG